MLDIPWRFDQTTRRGSLGGGTCLGATVAQTHLPFEGPHAVGVNHQKTITSTSYIWANLCPHSEANQFCELHRSISATELLWCNTDLQSSRDKCFLASYLHTSGVWVHCVIHPSPIISRGMLYRIYGCKSAYTRCEFTYVQPWCAS